MTRTLVWFSCGAASAVAAKLTLRFLCHLAEMETL
jgi:hypothetical protein